MSKAEERALEIYPKMSRITEHYGVIPADYESYYIGDANEEKRMGFIKGYHQAEKDLELTWEDISDIIEIHEDVLEMESCENVYMEVLKRFKTMKATNIPTREELNKLENEYLNTIAKVKA